MFDIFIKAIRFTINLGFVVADLERIKKVLLDNYKYEIDQAFVGK